VNAGAKAPAGAKRPPSGAPPASERAAGGPTPATDPNRPTFEFGLMPLVPATAGARGAASRAARLLVDGVATPDQMSKDAFLGQLRAAVLAAAGEELAGSGWTAEGCPWIDHWFAYYGARSAEEVEEALLKYAPEARSAVAAEGYVAPAVARVRLAIGRWRKSGEIDAPETPAAPLDAGSPTAVRARLGAGQPLAGDARARMEQGFGRSFADVRVHTGAGAAAAADRLGASAFTVGNSIAFGAGLAPSGGIAGDLLLAHELAHTTQQRGAPGAPAAAPGVDEAGADRAAMTAVARTQGAQLEAPAAPALGGLALRRCNDFTPKTGAPA